MTYYFIGGEDHDFAKIGGVAVNTAATAARRTAYARCSLSVTAGATTDGWQGRLASAVSTFWLTARVHSEAWSYSTVHDALTLLDGSTRRLGLKTNGSSNLILFKRDAGGTNTTLATSSNVLSASTLLKLDIQVSYGTNNTINVYLDNVLWVTYTGDVTTNSAATLSGFVLGSPCPLYSTYWSEVICGTSDTRALSLCTLPPAANGNAFAWTGSYASVNEVTLDDATLSTSATANQLLQATVTSTGLAGTPAIRAVCVSARAQKGGTGPQNIQMAVRTGGNDYFSGTLALPAALDRVANIFETNPATSGPWAYTDLTAAGFNIGAKSIT